MRHALTWENVPFKPQLSLELIEGDETSREMKVYREYKPLGFVRGGGGLTVITLCPLVASAPSSSAIGTDSST